MDLLHEDSVRRVAILRPALDAAVLATLNIMSILAGFAMYKIIGGANQLMIQVPAAVMLTAAGYGAWALFRETRRGGEYRPTVAESALAYVLAFVWFPIMFVPLHYVTQGYVTSFGNITAVWLFQLPANLLAIGVSVIARGAANRGGTAVAGR